MGWTPEETFETGLGKTIRWYLENPQWVESVQTGEYREWIKKNYGNRKMKSGSRKNKRLTGESAEYEEKN